MAITPNNFRAPLFSTSLELTSALNNASWSATVGKAIIYAGSNGYKRIFQGFQPGNLTIQASLAGLTAIDWAAGYNTSQWTYDATAKNLTVANAADKSAIANAVASTVGQIVFFTFPSALGSYQLVDLRDNGVRKIRIYYDGTKIQVYKADESLRYAYPDRNGATKLKFEIAASGSDKVCKIYLVAANGAETLIWTTAETFNTDFSTRIEVAGNVPTGTVFNPFQTAAITTESASGYIFQARFALPSVWYPQGQTVYIENISSIAEGAYSFLWTLNGVDISTAQNLPPITNPSIGVNTLKIRVTEQNGLFSEYVRTFFVSSISGASLVPIGNTAQYTEANISDKVWHTNSADPSRSTITQGGLFTANRVETTFILLRNYLLTQLSAEATVDQFGASATVAQNTESQPVQYVETLKDVGDEITWTKGAAGEYGFALYRVNPAGTIKALYRGSVFLDYSAPSGSVNTNVASSPGDVLKMRVMPDFRIGFYKNGVLQVQTVFPVDLTGNNRIITNLYLYQTPVGTVIHKPAFSGSGYGGLKYAEKTVSTYVPINANFSLPADIYTNILFTTNNLSTGNIAAQAWELNGVIISTDQNVSRILPKGNYTLTLIVYEAGTGASDSHTITFRVDDIPPPSISIISPGNNAKITGNLTIAATVAGFVAAPSVQFKVNDTNVGSPDLSPPYEISFPTSGIRNGNHTLRAIATGDGITSQTAIQISIFNTFVIGEFFEWDRVRRPKYYHPSQPDWDAVTRPQVMEDGGVNFNELNNVAPRTWELRYTGLKPEENAMFEAHWNLKRISRSFSFIAKDGQTYTNVFYKESRDSWNDEDSGNITRSIVLIKYP